MPPQTRLKLQQRVSTPPPAPVPRVYRPSRPVQQQHFKPKPAVVRKYGRRSLPANLRQQTLTQIDYLVPVEPEAFDLGAIGDEVDEKPQKRRRIEKATPSSSSHTQTLTQLPWASSFKDEEKDNLLLVADSEEEGLDDDEVAENGKGQKDPGTPVSKFTKTEIPQSGESSPLTPTVKQDRALGFKLPLQDRSSNVLASAAAVPAKGSPQTPSGKEARAELPSSHQPKPPTPILQRSPNYLRIDPIRSENSPTSGKSTQSNAPPPAEAAISRLPRNFVIQDSFASSRDGSSQMPSSTTPHVLRSARSQGIAKPLAQSPRSVRRSQRQPLAEILVEIPDSDDELLSLGPTPGRVLETPSTTRIAVEIDLDDEAPEPATPTPVVREVPVAALEGSLPRLKTPAALLPKAVAISSDEPSSVRSTAGPRSAMMTSEPVEGQAEEETPISSANDSPSPPSARRSPAKTQFDTQFLESQRLALETMQSFAPITDRSDIIISIHPPHVSAIANGTKNHEFRSYRIPHTVSRFWIYTTLPVAEMRYMAVVSPAKAPGEIDANTGEGNADFCLGKLNGKGGGFAYELIQVYQLNNPVSLEGMKANGWVEGPPQKYEYVPPAVVGHLLGNLRCALFETPVSEEHLTISQELAEQLLADAEHTQAIASDSVTVPSSQKSGRSKRTTEVSFALPTLPIGKRNFRGGAVRPSQATTASQPSTQAISSSPGKQSVVGRPPMGSSTPSVGNQTTQGAGTQGGDSLIRNSQLGLLGITSSQASLMGRMFDSADAGLEIISDSEEGDLE